MIGPFFGYEFGWIELLIIASFGLQSALTDAPYANERTQEHEHMGVARRSEDLMDDFDAIREFATSRQCEVLDAIEKAGSKCGAARALGVYPSYISKT